MKNEFKSSAKASSSAREVANEMETHASALNSTTDELIEELVRIEKEKKILEKSLDGQNRREQALTKAKINTLKTLEKGITDKAKELKKEAVLAEKEQKKLGGYNHGARVNCDVTALRTHNKERRTRTANYLRAARSSRTYVSNYHNTNVTNDNSISFFEMMLISDMLGHHHHHDCAPHMAYLVGVDQSNARDYDMPKNFAYEEDNSVPTSLTGIDFQDAPSTRDSSRDDSPSFGGRGGSSRS